MSKTRNSKEKIKLWPVLLINFPNYWINSLSPWRIDTLELPSSRTLPSTPIRHKNNGELTLYNFPNNPLAF